MDKNDKQIKPEIKSNYLDKMIEREEIWVHNHFYSTKAIILNVLTLGFYGLTQWMNYNRRIGLW